MIAKYTIQLKKSMKMFADSTILNSPLFCKKSLKIPKG